MTGCQHAAPTQMLRALVIHLLQPTTTRGRSHWRQNESTHIGRCGERTRRVCWWRWVRAGLWSTASPCRPRRKQTDCHRKRCRGRTPPAHGGTGYETSPLTSWKDPPDREAKTDEKNRERLSVIVIMKWGDLHHVVSVVLLVILKTHCNQSDSHLVQTRCPQIDQRPEDAGRKRLACLLDADEQRNPKDPATFHLHRLVLTELFRNSPAGDKNFLTLTFHVSDTSLFCTRVFNSTAMQWF